MATDHPTITIGVFGRSTKQVVYYTGCYLRGNLGRADRSKLSTNSPRASICWRKRIVGFTRLELGERAISVNCEKVW